MEIQQIEDLILLSDIEGTFKSLTPLVENTIYAPDVIRLNSRFNDMRSGTKQRALSFEDALKEKNQITAALVDIVNQLKKNASGDTSTDSHTVSVNGTNNQVYVGVKNSTINHTTQNHSGSGDNVAGNKIVEK
jgi:Effector-associated domain 11